MVSGRRQVHTSIEALNLTIESPDEGEDHAISVTIPPKKDRDDASTRAKRGEKYRKTAFHTHAVLPKQLERDGRVRCSAWLGG